MTTLTETRESGAYLPREAAGGKPLQLAMQQLILIGKILPFGAHLLVRHSFRPAGPKLLEAVYSFVLPRDAALRRFEIKGPDCARRLPRARQRSVFRLVPCM